MNPFAFVVASAIGLATQSLAQSLGAIDATYETLFGIPMTLSGATVLFDDQNGNFNLTVHNGVDHSSGLFREGADRVSVHKNLPDSHLDEMNITSIETFYVVGTVTVLQGESAGRTQDKPVVAELIQELSADESALSALIFLRVADTVQEALDVRSQLVTNLHADTNLLSSSSNKNRRNAAAKRSRDAQVEQFCIVCDWDYEDAVEECGRVRTSTRDSCYWTENECANVCDHILTAALPPCVLSAILAPICVASAFTAFGVCNAVCDENLNVCYSQADATFNACVASALQTREVCYANC